MKHAKFPRSTFRAKLRLIIPSVWFLVCLFSSSGLIAAEPLAKGIQDNSFFIEEAYNQEPGVVQHIFNLPIDFTNGSREIAPSFTQEWPVFSQTNYNVGASAIYAISKDFNLMLETLAGWNEDIAEGVFAFEETVERGTTAIISPGVRYASNLPNDAQLVIGAALPIGLTSDSPD